MNEPLRTRDEAAMRSVGILAALGAELDTLEGRLRAAPSWQPGKALLAEAAWCREQFAQLEISWGRKLAVALVGPSGAGKSTLLNALAGKELSPTGRTRPTTRQIIIYAASAADAEPVVEHCGREHVRVAVDGDAPHLAYLLLIDTPDTNTLPENQRLLSCVLERADLLLAIFPAQNPKMQDNIAFLRPYVQRLPADAVLPVLNFVDRAPRHELEESVLPDFRAAIGREWGIHTDRIYLISAKASLPDATFPEDETPLHNLNQIDRLRETLFQALNRASQVVDRRVAQAEHLVQVFKRHCAEALAQTATPREQAEQGLQSLSRHSQQIIVETVLAQGERGQGLDLHAAFYSLLGQRWWGPVGWLVMLWGLILRIGTFFTHLGRPRPLLLARWMGGAEQAAPSLPAPEPVTWVNALSHLYAQHWPPLADTLTEAGFEGAVREAALWREWVRARGEQVHAQWLQIYEERLLHLIRSLSAWLLQLLFNAPILGLIGWVCVETVLSFFQQRYLPADYFRHAGIAALTIWLASFVLLQIVVSVALRASFRRQVARALSGATLNLSGPLQEQLEALKQLQRLAAGRRRT